MIIGLAGPAGVGKTTFANALVEYLNHHKVTCTKVAFADALREDITEATYGGKDITSITNTQPPNDVVDGYTMAIAQPYLLYHKPTHPLIRRLLQWWGTDFRRAQDPNYWLKAWVKALPPHDETPNIVVDDIRFENEAKLVEALGGVVVQLSRDTETIAPTHASKDFRWFRNISGVTYQLQSPSGGLYDAHDFLKWIGYPVNAT